MTQPNDVPTQEELDDLLNIVQSYIPIPAASSDYLKGLKDGHMLSQFKTVLAPPLKPLLAGMINERISCASLWSAKASSGKELPEDSEVESIVQEIVKCGTLTTVGIIQLICSQWIDVLAKRRQPLALTGYYDQLGYCSPRESLAEGVDKFSPAQKLKIMRALVESVIAEEGEEYEH
ncbi:MAG: hypothetical protein F6K21_05675 [Symploca sp. SIO2D2]|nr:hypothetical protein [Symploca sp. SIO2D2]